MQQVVRCSDKKVKEKSGFLKDLSVLGLGPARYLASRVLHKVSFQNVPCCDVGCDHCSGFACMSNDSVLLPSDIEKYLQAVKDLNLDDSYSIPSVLTFSGAYGDPFCGFGEKNSVNYFLKLIKSGCGFDEVGKTSFVTSGYHLGIMDEFEEFLNGVKDMEARSSNAGLFDLCLSVDAFHGKRVSNELLRDVVAMFKKVYGSDELVIPKIGFIGQTALSEENPRGGSEYLNDFCDFIRPVFDDSRSVDRIYKRVNATITGRKIIGSDFSGNSALLIPSVFLTKSEDGALVLIYQKGKKRYEYKIEENTDGSLSRNSVGDVAFSLALDSLSLKIPPVSCYQDGVKKIILTKDLCDDRPFLRSSGEVCSIPFETLKMGA